ncbi:MULTISPECIES: cobalt ECF transporter T component CbiQ [Catellatospora]|uniref:Cobalt ECF transporter T component CbiQ n=1 Tax=Catellatospora chokoriensis TaxID=310353 RepID=A0A8J3NUH8_9ACTN|nr:cobalt ECF transporter T component CbiQ [Catellatospora chokoriensis]GIF92756.1 cobalt ECF transporter T component CbiQ [Catellatospora chokoriensis]
MGAGHTHPMYVHGHSPVHHLAPEVKIAVSVLFTIVVVATPRELLPAFGAYAVIVAVLAVLARIPAGWLARRSLIELPFVATALLLPFFAAGPRTDVLGLSVAVEGLWAGWNILVKGTLGVLVALLLAGTTPARDVLVGLDRLRTPQAITQIALFMLRYLDVLADEARRMRIARLSRLDDPRFLWQLRGFAAGLGTLFLRAFERGERVFLAMRSRGYTGRLPAALHEGSVATARQWAVGATVPVLAVVVLLTDRFLV